MLGAGRGEKGNLEFHTDKRMVREDNCETVKCLSRLCYVRTCNFGVRGYLSSVLSSLSHDIRMGGCR